MLTVADVLPKGGIVKNLIQVVLIALIFLSVTAAHAEPQGIVCRASDGNSAMSINYAQQMILGEGPLFSQQTSGHLWASVKKSLGKNAFGETLESWTYSDWPWGYPGSTHILIEKTGENISGKFRFTVHQDICPPQMEFNCDEPNSLKFECNETDLAPFPSWLQKPKSFACDFVVANKESWNSIGLDLAADGTPLPKDEDGFPIGLKVLDNGDGGTLSFDHVAKSIVLRSSGGRIVGNPKYPNPTVIGQKKALYNSETADGMPLADGDRCPFDILDATSGNTMIDLTCYRSYGLRFTHGWLLIRQDGAGDYLSGYNSVSFATRLSLSNCKTQP